MKKGRRISRIRPLLGAYSTHAPGFALCSVFFYVLFLAALYLINYLASMLLLSSGQVAVTSGSLRVLITSWQGVLILALAGICLPAATCGFLNAGIFLTDALIEQKPIRPVRALAKGFCALSRFLRPGGFSIVLYYMAIVPLTLMTVLFFLRTPFELPGFVLYTLNKKLIFRIAYALLLIFALQYLLRSLMIIHRVLLDGQPPRAVRTWLRESYRPRRRRLYSHILLFLALFAAVLIAVYAGYVLLPSLLKPLPLLLPHGARRVLLLLVVYAGIGLFVLLMALLIPLLLSEVTRLYLSCRAGEEILVPRKEDHTPGALVRYLVPALLLLTLFSAANFDVLFPAEVEMDVVVHRLGGFEEAENTLEGLDRALELGALAAETDVQRTADGHYVIFHDVTAARMCGVNQRISRMTLEEVRALKLPGVNGDTLRIPTLEEVLDAAKGRMFLYIELKGPTADQQMADDVIAMIRERGMEQECALISMRYPTIKYVHETCDDIRTGLLYFFAYGKESLLEADMLIMQSNAASSVLTESVHAQGKKLLVWTVNTPKIARSMLRTNIDGIITDKYSLVDSVKEGMSRRSDYRRIMDRLGW